MRMSFEEALNKVSRNEFEKIFHSLLTYKEMASYFKITPTQVVNLIKYWNLSWTKEEISKRKSHNSSKYDKNISNEKRLKTFKEKYNTTNPRIVTHPETYTYTKEKHDEWLRKYRSTSLKKFNVLSYSSTAEFKERMINSSRKTFANRYGVNNPMQVKEFKDKVFSYHGYRYNDICFDSSWELIYYIYQVDKGSKIIREPYGIPYTYNNTTYMYYPDFLVNNELVEVKGDCYVNRDNDTFVDIRHNSDPEKLKAKYKCMIENVSKVLYSNDLKECVKYVNDTYGKDYISQFKVN